MFGELLDYVAERQRQWSLTETAWDALIPGERYDPQPRVAFVRPMVTGIEERQIGHSQKGAAQGSYLLIAQVMLPARGRADVSGITSAYSSLWRRHERPDLGIWFREPDTTVLGHLIDEQFFQIEIRVPVITLSTPLRVQEGAEQMEFSQAGSSFPRFSVLKATSTGFALAAAGTASTDLGAMVVTDQSGSRFNAIGGGFAEFSTGHGFSLDSRLYLTSTGGLGTTDPGLSPGQTWGDVVSSTVLLFAREDST